MRVVTPFLTQTPGTVRVPALATLEQGLVDVTRTQGAPSGYTDWQQLIGKVQTQIAKEPSSQGKAILSSALATALAAAPIPVAGWVVAAAGAALTLFGITIRGKTQHVDAPTSVAKAVEFVQTTILPIWLSIPPLARVRFFQQTVEFDKYMWSTFSYWWGGAMQRDRVPFEIFPVAHYTQMSDSQMRDYLSGSYNIYAFYFAEIMHEADATSVDENLKTWYMDPLAKYVLKPLDDYLLAQFNSHLSDYTATTGKAISPAPGKGITPLQAGIGLGAGALLLGAVLSRKRGRR